MRYILSTILAVVFIVLLSTTNSMGTESEQRPLVAYKARIIPEIDGIMSPGEWNDTDTYEYIRDNPDIMDGPIKLQCALKYDDEWLYVLFKVNDDDYYAEPPTDDDMVDILTEPIKEDGYTDKAFVVLHNGTKDIIKNAMLAKSAIVTNWSSSSEGEANSTYSNESKEYTFEIKISLLYLQINHTYAPFNIEFTEMFYGISTVSIGDSRYTRPGIVLSPSYYMGTKDETSNVMKMPMERAILIVLIIIFVPLCVFLYLRRRWKYGQQK